MYETLLSFSQKPYNVAQYYFLHFTEEGTEA